MARRFTPVGPRSPSGVSHPVTGAAETFAQTQARHAGGPSKGVFDQARVGPEKFYNTSALQGMADLFDQYASGAHVTPFELNLDRAGLQEYARQAEAYESNLPPSGSFNPQDFRHANETSWAGQNKSPAPLSLNPTSTINPKRPRTLAAGFEFDPGSQTEGKLTIMFRDGTIYNYYDVPEEVWQTFKRMPSKGRFIADELDWYLRGYADVSSSSGGRRVAPATRKALHKSAKVAQTTLHAQRPRASGKRTVQVAKHTRRRARR